MIWMSLVFGNWRSNTVKMQHQPYQEDSMRALLGSAASVVPRRNCWSSAIPGTENIRREREHAISINRLSTQKFTFFPNRLKKVRARCAFQQEPKYNSSRTSFFACMYTIQICVKNSQCANCMLIALLQCWDLPYLSSPWWSPFEPGRSHSFLHHTTCSYLFIPWRSYWVPSWKSGFSSCAIPSVSWASVTGKNIPWPGYFQHLCSQTFIFTSIIKHCQTSFIIDHPYQNINNIDMTSKNK